MDSLKVNTILGYLKIDGILISRLANIDKLPRVMTLYVSCLEALSTSQVFESQQCIEREDGYLYVYDERVKFVREGTPASWDDDNLLTISIYMKEPRTAWVLNSHQFADPTLLCNNYVALDVKWLPLTLSLPETSYKTSEDNRNVMECYGLTVNEDEGIPDNLKFMGSGSYGRVYEVPGQMTYPTAVIKANQYRTHQDWEDFQLEYLIQSQLDHPYIAKMYGMYKIDMTPTKPGYYSHIIECVRGYEAELLFGNISTYQALCVFRAQLEAIEYLIKRNVIHTDLSAKNVMVIIDDVVSIKLIDFGFARSFNPDHPIMTDEFTGTYMYMPPEALGQNNRFDATKCDLWSTAITFLQLLCGPLNDRFNAVKLARERNLEDESELFKEYYNSDFLEEWKDVLLQHDNGQMIYELLNQIFCPEDVRLSVTKCLQNPLLTGLGLWPELAMIPFKIVKSFIKEVKRYINLPFIVKIFWLLSVEAVEVDKAVVNLCNALYLCYERTERGIIGDQIIYQDDKVLPSEIFDFIKDDLKDLRLNEGMGLRVRYKELLAYASFRKNYRNSRLYLWQRLSVGDVIQISEIKKKIFAFVEVPNVLNSLLLFADENQTLTQERFFKFLDQLSNDKNVILT